jgi:hypothetical protein
MVRNPKKVRRTILSKSAIYRRNKKRVNNSASVSEMINFPSTSTNAIITKTANDHGQASVSEMVNFPSTSTNAIIKDNANHHGQASVSEMVNFTSTYIS